MKGPTSNGVTGGAEKYSEELANVLEMMGFEVEVYCGRDKGESDLPSFEQRSEKISVRRFNSLFNFLPFSIISMHLYYIFKGKRSSDYIIENQSVIPLLTPIYKKSLFTIILHLTGKDYIRKQGLVKGSIGIFLEDYLMPLVYKHQDILTISNHTKTGLESIGFNEEKISVIPPIVNKINAKHSYSRNRENIISYIGRYTGVGGNKRIDDVIEILPEVIKAVPNAKLIIGGSMKKQDELLAIIERLNLQKYVEFKGFLTDEQKAEILAESKVFASPSYQEGFGITYIEAHGFGTPVVGYEIEGLDTVPKESGFMVAKGDKKALANSIIQLLSDEHVWESKSHGALKNASLYETSGVQKEYQAFFKKILKQRKEKIS